MKVLFRRFLPSMKVFFQRFLPSMKVLSSAFMGSEYKNRALFFNREPLNHKIMKKNRYYWMYFLPFLITTPWNESSTGNP